MRTPADIAGFDQRHAQALRSIWFLGDVHNEFRHIERALQRCARTKQSTQLLPEWLVFLGDQDLELSSLREVVRRLRQVHEGLNVAFIHGNHDGDSFDKWALLHDCADAVALHGEVMDLAGVRVAGLGGNFLGRVWTPPSEPVHESREALLRDRAWAVKRDQAAALRGAVKGADNATGNGAAVTGAVKGTVNAAEAAPGSWVFNRPTTPSHLPGGESAVWPASPKLLSAIYPRDLARLAQRRADILVTHEAPSCHHHGWAAFDELARSLRVYRSFHGHTHDDLSDQYALQTKRLGFDARAVSFCCIKNGLGEFIAGPPNEIKG